MVYKGSGGPPPSQVRRENAERIRNKPFGFNFYEVLPNGKKKKVGRFRVDVGEKDVPFVFLDEALPDIGAIPSVRVHEFKFNGSYGNISVCNAHKAEGCLMDKALERPNPFRNGEVTPLKGSWKWVGTGIKMKPFTYTKGPLAGQTINHQRCMLLVPDKQYPMFMAFRETYEKLGGLRGKVFNVRRDDDKRSSKIGTLWMPAGEMTDEEMTEKFAESAGLYGLPIEDYIRPYDYEHVLRELTTEEMNDAAKWVAAENNVDLGLGGDKPKTETDDSSTEDDDTEIPF